AHLRPFLQHQALRRGDGPRPVDLSGSRESQRERHPGSDHAGRRDGLHGLAPGREAGRREGAVMRPRILVVDNDAEMVALLRRHPEAEGWSVTGVTSGEDAQIALARDEYAVVLTDLVMEPVDGLGVLREAQRVQPRARVILMTAFGSLESAIDAMRHGAYDY